MMWGYHSWPMTWGWGSLMWLVPLGLVILLIWALVRPARGYRRRFGLGRNGYWDAGDPALEMLRQRLAKGEISEDEYEKLKERLLK